MSPDVAGYAAKHAQQAEGQQGHRSYHVGSRKKLLRECKSWRGKADACQ